jgi:hypothetical protein
MFTLYACYKVIENYALKDSFLERNNLSPQDISYAIGKLWEAGSREYYQAREMNDRNEIFDALGGYQHLTQIYKLTLGMALDVVIALGIYHTYNTFISNDPTFTSKESVFQDDSSNTTNQTLTDLSPGIIPMGEVLHNNPIDH